MIQDDRLEKKEKLIEYLTRMPFYRWAAKSIGKDEDTIINWRKEDPDFAERCEAAKSEAIAKLGKRATPDFLLACSDPKTFAKAKQVEVKVLPTPILANLTKDVSNNNSNPQDSKSE
jgi:hypothetical protein